MVNKDNNTYLSTSDLFLKYAANKLSLHILRPYKDYELPAFSHAHPEYEFLIPETPIPNLSINQVPHYGESGKVYYIPSYIEHGTERLVNASFLSVVIAKDFFEETRTRLGVDPKLPLPTEFTYSPKLNNLLSLFKEEIIAIHPSSECLHHLSALISMEMIFTALGERADLKRQNIYQYLKSIKDTADYMMANVQRELTIDKLASLCNMSRFHYIRTFKKCFGETPYQYLLKIRLCVGRLLLENTELAIGEISSKAGFQSPNRFTELFKEKIKMTPTEYRRHHYQTKIKNAD
jgi:AraC-like DNA-binding protein